MLPPETLQRIDQALTDLRHGSVQLIVHEGQIVRIERTQRIRLTVTPEALTIDNGQSSPTQEIRRHV